jgi:hypothetical protein
MDMDILEFGHGLVAATPALVVTARDLTDDPLECRVLVQRTLRCAWDGREAYSGPDLHAWLHDMLGRYRAAKGRSCGPGFEAGA